MAWGASAPAASVNTNIAATSFATASWTPTPNRLLVVYVAFSIAAGTAAAPTLSGNGLTWTFVRQGIGANPDGIACYVALTTSAPTTGVLTIDFAGVTQTYCIAQVIEIDGVDISGTALAAVIQNDGTSPAAQASPFSRSFGAVPQVSSRIIAGYYLTLNTAMTPRASWTELFDAGNAAAPARELEIQWRSDASEQTYSVSGWAGSVQFRAAALELKAVTAPLANSSPRRVKHLRPVPRTRSTPVLDPASPPVQRPASPPTPLRHLSYLRRARITSVTPSSPAPINPVFPLSPTSQRRVARGFARRGRTFAPPLPFRYPPRRVGAAATTGTATSLTPSITALLGLPDITPYFVLACIKVFTGGVLSMSGSGWASSTNTWDAGGEQAIWIWKEPGVPAADPAFVWGGASIAYALSVVAYDGTHLTDAASSGFDAYSYPSIASGIEVGGTLVHVKAGDKDNQFGPCPNAAGFVQLVDAQAVGAGNVTINERDLYNSTSYVGPAVGNDKGIGFLFAIGSTPNPPPSFIAQLRRRIFHAPRSRRATIQPVPDQQAAPANPAIVFGRTEPRVVRAALRRSRSVQPVPGQQTVAAGPARRAVRGWLRRGGKTTVVVPAPAAPVNPAIVFYTPPRVRGRGFLRRSKIVQPVPAPQAPPVNPALPGNSQPRRRVFGWFLRRRQPRTPIGLIVLSPLNAPTPTNVTGPDGRASVSGSTGIASVSGPDGRSAVTGPNGSTIV